MVKKCKQMSDTRQADIPTAVQQAHLDTPRVFHVLGVASCVGASDRTCQEGPEALRALLKCQPLPDLRWVTTLRDPQDVAMDAYAMVAALAPRVAQQTQLWSAHGHQFVVVGGDHSCAIGTWSGVARSLRGRGALGLLWIDAHMDAHTPETSPSGALHGMPLAMLLGAGPPDLVRLAGTIPALQPRHVWLIGVRSYEAQEQQRLTDLGVNIRYMTEVKTRGLAAIIAEALADLQRNTEAFGVSVDLDALDPVDAPGVGSPEPGGITADALLAALHGLGRHAQVVGLEIAELNPRYDLHQKTVRLAYDLLAAWIGYGHPRT
ncbi:MAG: arginase [Gammaproteobacteria bacterium]|nr:arginase [Gammaproteobacteria bacterium]